jgi:hypothetical protein
MSYDYLVRWDESVEARGETYILSSLIVYHEAVCQVISQRRVRGTQLIAYLETVTLSGPATGTTRSRNDSHGRMSDDDSLCPLGRRLVSRFDAQAPE